MNHGTAKLIDIQASRRLYWIVFGGIFFIPMLYQVQFRPDLLLEQKNLRVMGQFLEAFFPPKLDLDFLRLIFYATLETLAMATAGMALAIVGAFPLALIISNNFSISSMGARRGGWVGKIIRLVCRLLVILLRGIPELVWALVWVRIFGLGTTAGVLAIAVTYAGLLGKVYSDILESSPKAGTKALLMQGSGRLIAFCFATLPECSQELASYTVYRWECAVRASVVMGFVGAGGLGQLMDQSMKMLSGSEVSTILLIFLSLVFLADVLSYLIRMQLK